MYFPTGFGATAAPAASSAPPAAQLQNALKALGTTAGDPKLMGVTVDGVVGPKTVAAVNHALANYVGGTPAFPRADLTVAKVRQYAGALATLVSQRVAKSGGTVPAAVIRKSAPRGSSSAMIPLPASSAPREFSMEPSARTKWMLYALGGGSVLLLLWGIADAVQRRKKAAA